jgi:hypothetical protein
MLEASAAVSRPAKLRSKLTNDPTLLPGVDRRSSGGRRFLDIAELVAAEFPDASTIAIRELASLRFTLEREQGAIVAADNRSLEDLVRLTNAVERKERALRLAQQRALRSGASAGSASIRDKLLRKYPNGGAP